MRAGGRQEAPVALRVLAFAIDVALTLLVLVALRPLLASVPLGFWKATLGFGMLAWLLLRYQMLGKTPGLWLLCLRHERPSGRPVPVFAPASWETRRRWRVCCSAPGAVGLAVRLGITALALLSALWAASMLRPSIGGTDAEHLAAVLVLNDAPLRHTLGEPVRLDIRSVARRGQQGEAGTASFALRLRGQHARQDMRVHARRVQGAWSIEELSDIEVAPAGDTAEVAER